MAHLLNGRQTIRLNNRSLSRIIFCFSWISGLICGCIIAVQVSDTYLLMMRRAVTSPVSIFGLLTVSFLPFLFITLSVYISRPKLIHCICFLKACSFMITGFSVITVFGSAGWLVQFLLQFTDLGALALLCWFACQHLDGSKNSLGAHITLCGTCVAGLVWIEYCYVSPFLAMLIENSQMGR